MTPSSCRLALHNGSSVTVCRGSLSRQKMLLGTEPLLTCAWRRIIRGGDRVIGGNNGRWRKKKSNLGLRHHRFSYAAAHGNLRVERVLHLSRGLSLVRFRLWHVSAVRPVLLLLGLPRPVRRRRAAHGRGHHDRHGAV